MAIVQVGSNYYVRGQLAGVGAVQKAPPPPQGASPTSTFRVFPHAAELAVTDSDQSQAQQLQSMVQDTLSGRIVDTGGVVFVVEQVGAIGPIGSDPSSDD